ncbi:MAG: dipeptidase [Candidatus Omnitrophica bacterium]|nr:dipeptidase [Candidatus Omnitrophota bacterium]
MTMIADYVAAHRNAFLQELIGLLQIPSISAQTNHREDVARCAQHLTQLMLASGLERAEVIPTAGHPIAYGEWLGAPGKPTLLIYGHYDVQPADPLNLWTSPPFEPAVRGTELYARGAVDDKGQVHVHLKAVETLIKTSGALPVNLKMMVEGEEEIGSEHLEEFLRTHRERLAADVVIISDTPMLQPEHPAICYGLRGLCYMEIIVEGPAQDLHSGALGGIVANPAQVLAEIIAKLKSPDGRILIPGFYDKVRPLSREERKRLASLPMTPQEWLQLTGSPRLSGEPGYPVVEQLWARPTLDVNGIVGGYIEEGAKTIIPAKASAKISMRLVPNQDPKKIATLFERHIRQLVPPTVKVAVLNHHGAKPFYMALDHPACKVAAGALAEGFGHPTNFIREGGSIPFVNTIAELFGKPCLLIGFGLPDEQAHAPDEHLHLPNYFTGVAAMAEVYERMAALRSA